MSPASLELTRSCLDALTAGRHVQLRLGDVLGMPPQDVGPFDSVVMSELLEHLEAPAEALRSARGLMSAGGRLFVNVPINSPSIDHIYHFHSQKEIAGMIEGCGFSIDERQPTPSSGYSLAKAIAGGTTISCAFVATKTDQTGT